MNNKSKCFKVTNLYGGSCLPLYKPNIEEILRINATATIDEKILVTIKESCTLGISLEGQIRTKHKLIIMGNIYCNITYSPTNPQQCIHHLQVTIPFCDYIALPNKINFQSFIQPNVVIQDVYINKFNDRNCYINIVIMLLVDIY